MKRNCENCQKDGLAVWRDRVTDKWVCAECKSSAIEMGVRFPLDFEEVEKAETCPIHEEPRFCTIYWMNQHHQDWTEDVLYTKEQAKTLLESQGYQLNGGWYTREQVGWEGNTRAMICHMSIFKG